MYYLQVYLNNCAYKIVNKQMTDYLDNFFFFFFLILATANNAFNISNIAVVTVKNVDYCCIIHNISS